MKKRIAIVGLIMALAVGFCVTATALADSSAWKIVDSKFYQALPVNSDTPLLVSVLQQSDYADIQNELYDDTRLNDALSSIANEENADSFEAENYLRTDWMEVQDTLIKDRLTIRTLSETTRSNTIDSNELTVNVISMSGVTPLEMRTIQMASATFVIPQNLNDFPAQFSITPDASHSIIATERGLWTINGADTNLQRISTTYSTDGQDYDELAELSNQLYGENIIKWNDNLVVSPDSQSIAYLSNRDNVITGGVDIYAMNLNSATEAKLTSSNNYYTIVGWLNSEYLLCDKYEGDNHQIVAISLDGEETALPIDGFFPWVYAVKDNMIAFVPFLDSNEVTIARFNPNTKSMDIQSTVTMGAETRLRGGNYGFSPDCSKFAAIVIPEDNPSGRFMGIYDIVSGEQSAISAPASIPGAYIHEFSWIDNTNLLVAVGDKADVLTTWTYMLK